MLFLTDPRLLRQSLSVQGLIAKLFAIRMAGHPLDAATIWIAKNWLAADDEDMAPDDLEIHAEIAMEYMKGLLP